jgi:hypothetical protein
VHVSLGICLVAIVCVGCAQLPHAKDNSKLDVSGVRILAESNRVRVEINSRLFTEYFFKDVPKPYCYPLIGPGEVPVTRHYPQKDIPGEEHDHPHHHSFWFGFGDLNGHDFWREITNTGRIVHDGFLELRSSKKLGVIRSRNKWIAANGEIICTDERTLRFHNSGNHERIIDFEITLRPVAGDLRFGETKEGMVAVRVAESMRLVKPALKNEKPLAGNGHILNSAGVRDADAWGKRAQWVDYYGPVDGKIVGVAIFDHPTNFRHPPRWHARDYGLLAANPFGGHEYDSSEPKGSGAFTLPAGKSLTFRYRLLLHEGDDKQGRVAQKFSEFAREDFD